MFNLEYLSHLNILCINNLDSIGASTIDFLVLCPIEELISPVPLDIIICFLDHGHDQDENQRGNISHQEPNFEKGYKLRDGYQKEKHVKEELELVVEQLWQKGHKSVLLVV